MGTGIFSSDLDERLDALAQDAVTNAAVTGSVGSTAQITRREDSSKVDGVRVERIAQHAAGWRVADVTINDVLQENHRLLGSIIVLTGREGRYTSHAA